MPVHPCTQPIHALNPCAQSERKARPPPPPAPLRHSPHSQVQRMQAVLKPLMLRRLKEDVVAGEIPAKEEVQPVVPLCSQPL